MKNKIKKLILNDIYDIISHHLISFYHLNNINKNNFLNKCDLEINYNNYNFGFYLIYNNTQYHYRIYNLNDENDKNYQIIDLQSFKYFSLTKEIYNNLLFLIQIEIFTLDFILNEIESNIIKNILLKYFKELELAKKWYYKYPNCRNLFNENIIKELRVDKIKNMKNIITMN